MDKDWLARAFKMAKVDISANPVLFRHGEVQGAGADRSRGQALRYHISVVPEGPNLKNVVVLAYVASLG